MIQRFGFLYKKIKEMENTKYIKELTYGCNQQQWQVFHH